MLALLRSRTASLLPGCFLNCIVHVIVMREDEELLISLQQVTDILSNSFPLQQQTEPNLGLVTQCVSNTAHLPAASPSIPLVSHVSFKVVWPSQTRFPEFCGSDNGSSSTRANLNTRCRQ